MQATSTANAAADEAFERALQARTLCEAFQITAAARAEQVAVRTPDDSVSLTYGALAERVRRRRGWSRGAGRRTRGHGGHHAHEPARVPHRGPRCHAPGCPRVLDLQHVGARSDRVSLRRRRQPDRHHRACVRRAPDGRARRRHADRPHRRGRRRAGRHAQPRGGGGRRRPAVRLRRSVVGGRPRRPPHPDLHVRHDGSAQGGGAHSPQHDEQDPGATTGVARHAGWPHHLVPARRAHR